MTVGRFARQVGVSTIGALLLVGGLTTSAQAQGDHVHGPTLPAQELKPEQKAQAGALIETVRQWTARFKDHAVAEAEGYQLQFGCVSGGDFGAMGLHFVNFALVGDGEIDVTRPEIVLYEPLPNGKVRLTGADFLVLADAWNDKHTGPPKLMGQLFHLFDSPNRFGLPAFYTLHVWAWKDNPNGAFVNWNPNVSCDAFVEGDR
jgi:hypothetical protein